MTTTTMDDEAFHRRIQGALQTVQAWEDDPLLLAECRAMIPWEALRGDNENGEYAQPKDHELLLSKDARFVQRLARYFKSSMTWVNNPACGKCQSKNTALKETRGPLTVEEREGQASRVEVYQCHDCGCDDAETTTCFPRYNSPRKLLETRQGRCGEYANLFGLTCRAMGLETRYILDLTDHVWTEVLLTDCQQHEYWMMCDGCEGVVDEPSMYEAGWGKQLNYIVAVAVDHVVDVTPRYTRQFHSTEMQARRRQHTSSEVVGERVVARCHELQQQSLSKKAKDSLNFRLGREAKELERLKNVTVWESGTYGQGRISGSLAWKLSRQEAGKVANESSASNGDAAPKGESSPPEQAPTGFQVESFYPIVAASTASSANGNAKKQVVSIAVLAHPKNRHGGIVVSWTPCAVGQSYAIDVVVVDEKVLTCILQSRSFHSLEALAVFVDTLPPLRIVAIRGVLPEAESPSADQTAAKLASLLGGFDASLAKEGILYIGQVRAKPDWTFCSTYVASPDGYTIQADVECITGHGNGADLGLKTERNAYPSAVTGRLSEACMPLKTQLLATHEQKRIAFLSFIKENPSATVSGYATRPGAPVYLLGETAFPFERAVSEGSDDESWNCFLRLPAALVPEGDVGLTEDNKKNTPTASTFEVPLDLNFFASQIGFELLQKENGMSTRRDTGSVLRNSRLVGLYFSAHWCGPCRAFTPMLAEMYMTLKEEYPTHGLEIIFVSSDRDPASFENYYGSHPWTAIPFDSLGLFKQQLGVIYGVQGIPNFVILDSISGQVVVPGNASRREVMQACQRGDAAIKDMFKDWLTRVPAETTELVAMLEASCDEHHVPTDTEDTSTSPTPAYLVKREDDSSTPVGPEANLLNGTFHAVAMPLWDAAWEIECTNRVLLEGSREQMKTLLATALKYVENAQKAPWNAKFRTFKLGNKVADAITRVPHGVAFLQCLGLELTATPHDFTAIIPLETDLDAMQKSISTKLDEFSK